MTVLWCEVHSSQQYALKKPPKRCDFVMLHGNWKIDPPCRMVPMRLLLIDDPNICHVCGADLTEDTDAVR